MKKNITLIIFIVLISFIVFVQPVAAHFLETDGSIGAVLHIDPNDNPIAGSQAGFFFEFKDRNNKFDPKNCDCTFLVSENGKVIFSQDLFQSNINPSLSNASVFYTFLQKDVYQIQITGKPTTSHTFQPFTLTWNMRVDQEVNATANLNQNTPNFLTKYFIYFAIIAAVLIVFVINRLRKSNVPKKDEKDHGSHY